MVDDRGDINTDIDHANGLYVADTRLLSSWRLDLGADMDVAATYTAVGVRRTVLLPRGRRNRPEPLMVQRQQTVDARGLSETVQIRNLSPRTKAVDMSLLVGVDFADQFLVRSDSRTFDRSRGRRTECIKNGTLELCYEHEGATSTFTASCTISAVPAPVIIEANGAYRLRWQLNLAGHAQICVDIRVGPDTTHPAAAPSPPTAKPSTSLPVGGPDPLLQQSLDDLDSLMMPAPMRPDLSVPAAGAPWFLTLFGRDSLLTAELARPYRPDMAPAVLRALAASQGRNESGRTLEQTGKIIHESRVGELAALDMIPYGRYFGSVDATPLFLVTLGRTVLGRQAHPGAPQLAHELREPAMAALSWIRGPGGLDEHGFLCYTADPGGLTNQGWKDSDDSTVTADGHILTGRTALCEVQGYCWDGLTRLARIARQFWRDEALADHVQELASQLRSRFLDQFWLTRQDFPALALVWPEGSTRPVVADALASNAGHLLWSKMLPVGKAKSVARRLTGSSFFSGWGIRTLADGQAPYSPLSYHNGSVWPHDSMLIASGMQTYGFHTQARLVATGVEAAGRALDNALPELIAGFSTQEFPYPVRYRFTGEPQAWSAAAAAAAADILVNARTGAPHQTAG